MKKLLLSISAIALASSAFAIGNPASQLQKTRSFDYFVGPKASAIATPAHTRAEGAMESFNFTYADEPYTALNLKSGGSTRVYMGFQMLAEDIKAFAGCQVTGFTMYSPTDYDGNKNTITEGRFFYTTDLSKEDYTQNFNITKTPFGDNVVTLDTPYTITGEEESLYFGYSLVTPKNDDMYYIVIDYLENFPNACIIGVSEDGNSMPKTYEPIGDYYGALCMSLKIEGEHLPKYVAFNKFPAQVCLPLNQASALPVALTATSGSDIETVDLEYTIGGNTYNSTFEFAPAIPAGVARQFEVNIEFPAFSEKYNEPVEFKLTKINGLDNEGDGMTAQATVVVVDEVPVHQTLYEEYTGTWCGYCTRGYAALEYIRENYPEFVVAAFHSGSQNSADPMQITNDFPTAVGGFPSAVLNRSTVVDPYYGTQKYDTELPIVGDILALNAVPSAWSIKVDHAWESDDVLVAKAEFANMAGFDNKNYRIAYLLVADGLTGKSRNWYQTNYYNTEKPQFIPQLNEFCKGGAYGKSSVGGLTFNDVVISTTGIYGEENSVPKTLEPEQVAEHTISFDLTAIQATLLPDKNKLRVIAAVVDPMGNVLNCAKNEVNDYEGAGVGAISTTDAPAEYFNLNGQKVADPSNGIFIRRQGGKAEKVIIR